MPAENAGGRWGDDDELEEEGELARPKAFEVVTNLTGDVGLLAPNDPVG